MKLPKGLFGGVAVLLFLSATDAVALSQEKAPGPAPSVQTLIETAYREHKQSVRIPPGTYSVIPPLHGPHLQFRHLSNFSIEATGVTLLLADPARGGIDFEDCNNVVLHGVTIRYIVPPFTQGVIESISADGSSYDVRIDRGYPTNLGDRRYFPAQPTGYLFDPQTTWWKPGTYDLSARRVEPLSADQFRFYWQRPAGPDVHPVVIGDRIAFRGTGASNLSLIDCSKMNMDGVTLLNAGSFAVWENGGEGANRYSITVKRGPKPAEATFGPLLSSTADAFHSSNVRKGPTVIHSYLESMPDDGIAIHGTYSLILEETGNRLIVNKNTFRPGDPILVYDAEGRPADEATVTAVAPLAGYQNTRKSRRTTLADNTVGPYVTLTLDHTVRASFDSLAENPAATGAGYVLRDNIIRNHRARGMLLKAPDGLVEHNTIDGSTMAGIALTPEFWWNEAGYSRNVIIRNNLIRHVAYAPHQLGGIVIAALDGPAPVTANGNRNILFEDNTLEDIDGVNLLITSSEQVTVRRNRFLHPQHARGSVAGAAWGEDPAALIYVTQARAIRFSENQVIDPGRFNGELVETRDASTEGERSGVTRAPQSMLENEAK